MMPAITFVEAPKEQYYRVATPKQQIYLHHTAGNADPHATLGYWNSTKERVGTSFIIAGTPPSKFTRTQIPWIDGEIVQCFNTKYASWHLGGVKALRLPPGSKSANELNLHSIGIEICNWGWLTEKNGEFYTYVNSVVPQEHVYELEIPFKGYRYYQRYTDAQIESTRQLLVYLGEKWDIPVSFKGMDIFSLDSRALTGESGVYTHNSVRRDKWDIFPQPELVQMLKSL